MSAGPLSDDQFRQLTEALATDARLRDEVAKHVAARPEEFASSLTGDLARNVVERADVRAELAAEVAADDDLQQAVAQRFAAALEGDRFPFRAAVVTFSAAILLVVVGVVALKLYDDTIGIPDVLVAIGTASVAALAGLLSPIGTGRVGSAARGDPGGG